MIVRQLKSVWTGDQYETEQNISIWTIYVRKNHQYILYFVVLCWGSFYQWYMIYDILDFQWFLPFEQCSIVWIPKSQLKVQNSIKMLWNYGMITRTTSYIFPNKITQLQCTQNKNNPFQLSSFPSTHVLCR